MTGVQERSGFVIRRAEPGDVAECAAVLAACYTLPPATATDLAGWMQTGTTLFVALREDRVCAMVRHWSDEGIDWFDLLASTWPWGGVALIRHLGHFAQDRGIRLVRTVAPDEPAFEGYFGYSGFRPVGRRTGPDGEALLVFERRVPLMTVREIRRSDADDLARLTGGDPWDFQYTLRPGWFVLSDGDRFAGYVRVREAGRGVGEISPPVVLEGYEGRRLELWMIERAAYYAETNAYHTLTLALTPSLQALRLDLEAAGWVREGEGMFRRLAQAPSYRAGTLDPGPTD